MTGVASGLRQRALRGMAWTGSGVAAELALQTLVVMVLARLLVPADFGVVAVALVVTGFVAIFGELGLIPALVQRERLEPHHLRTAFTVSLALALVIGLLLWLLSALVARVFGTPAVGPVLAALSVAPALRAWTSVPLAMLQRAMRFRDISLASVVSYVIGFGLVGVGMAAAGLGAWSLVGAHLAQALVQGVVLHVACPVWPGLGVQRAALRELLAYGGGVSLARFANYLATRGDNMFFGHALGPAALGLYAPAYHLMALPADLFQRIVQTVLFPAISRLQAEPARLAAAYRRGLALTGLTALPATALAILVAPELVEVLLGPRWRGVVVPLQILAAGMFFRVGYKTSVVFVKAVGAVGPFALRQALYPLLVLSLAWAGTSWDVPGVAAGVVAALAVQYVLLTGLGLRVVGLGARDYVAAHRAPLLVAGAVLAQAWLVLILTRAAPLPAWGCLIAVGLSTTATAAALIGWASGAALGPEGRWLRHCLAGVVTSPGQPRRVVASDVSR